MENKPLKQNYVISSATMLITPQFDEFGNVYSKIIEEDCVITTRARPLQIIKKACEYFGADLRGRQKATAIITGYTYKLPIAIEPYNSLYFFPTVSQRSITCSWLAHSHVLRINRLSSRQTEVIFYNGQCFTLDISKHTLTNQLQRTAQLRYWIEQRIKGPKADFQYPQLSHVADPRRYFRPFS